MTAQWAISRYKFKLTRLKNFTFRRIRKLKRQFMHPRRRSLEELIPCANFLVRINWTWCCRRSGDGSIGMGSSSTLIKKSNRYETYQKHLEYLHKNSPQ